MPQKIETGANSSSALPVGGLVNEVTPNFDVVEQGKTDFRIDTSSWTTHFNIIRNNHNIFTDTDTVSIRRHAKNYNRFKIPDVNRVLRQTFGHIFFMRPDLNIIKAQGSSASFELNANAANDPRFSYVAKNNPEVIKSLSRYGYSGHYFSMLLSNAASGTSLQDEALKTDTFGDTWTGHKIPYGKHNSESMSSGTFDVHYEDDSMLSIYQIHKLWVEYISRVYRGTFVATDKNIREKILDYATSVYYFLCAEDFETILFWAKYTGVFPNNVPSSTIGSWNVDSPLKMPSYDITYSYAFKEEYNPFLFTEFNNMSPGLSQDYVNSYDTNLLGAGKTIVGPPFVELLAVDGKYIPKLRFRREIY